MGFLLKSAIHLLLIAGAVLLIAHEVPGIAVTGFTSALLVALVWGFISLFIKPVLSLLALPINILTLGLFSLVVNALLFWLVSAVVPGFVVSGFEAAFIGAFILSVLQWLIHHLLG